MTRQYPRKDLAADCKDLAADRKDLAAGLRLDPSLQQGRRGYGLLWAVTAVVALAILVTFFALAGHTDSSAQNQLTPPATTGSSRR